MEAIVTDVDISSAVAGLRALGRRGIPTLAVASRRNAGGLRSRYASAWAVWPDALAEPAAFRAEAERVAGQLGDPIIYPGREEAIDALLPAGARGSPRLPYHDPDAVRVIRDKRLLSALTRRAGLSSPVPWAVVPASDLAAVDARPPFVIKPALPGGALRTAKLIATPQALEAVAESLPPEQELVVQEYVAGPQVGLALVIDRYGHVVERFQHEVRRTWPSHGGATSMAISVRPDEMLVRRSAAMLAGEGYEGLAQLDLIRTDTGYEVLDVNPRFYTSMPLALACGVNLPASWHETVRGEATPSPSEYLLGMRYRWLEADLTVLRHRWRPVFGPCAGALWDGHDPLPSVLMAARAGRHRVSAFVAAKRGRFIPNQVIERRFSKAA